jgi:hypothetical protein
MRNVHAFAADLVGGTAVARRAGVDLRHSEPDLPPPSAFAHGSGPNPLPRPRIPLPSMRDLSRIATNLATAQTLSGAVIQLQRDIRKHLAVADALCVWIDWAHGTAWTVNGQVGEQIQSLVTDVAGSGRRDVVHNTLLQPIGPSPARAVLALRRPSGVFASTELVMISTLASGLAPTLDRLIDQARVSGR